MRECEHVHHLHSVEFEVIYHYNPKHTTLEN